MLQDCISYRGYCIFLINNKYSVYSSEVANYFQAWEQSHWNQWDHCLKTSRIQTQAKENNGTPSWWRNSPLSLHLLSIITEKKVISLLLFFYCNKTNIDSPFNLLHLKYSFSVLLASSYSVCFTDLCLQSVPLEMVSPAASVSPSQSNGKRKKPLNLLSPPLSQTHPPNAVNGNRDIRGTQK